MYTKIEEAIYFMVKAYKGQRIKIENIDKSFVVFVIIISKIISNQFF